MPAGADRKTGLPIDETLHQQVTVGVAVAGQRVDVMPVLDVSAAVTPDSINSTANLADTATAGPGVSAGDCAESGARSAGRRVPRLPSPPADPQRQRVRITYR